MNPNLAVVIPPLPGSSREEADVTTPGLAGGAFRCGEEPGTHPRAEGQTSLGGSSSAGCVLGFRHASDGGSVAGVVERGASGAWRHAGSLADTESFGNLLTAPTFAHTVSPMNTSPATRKFDATDIDGLQVHAVVDGHALCDATLIAWFIDGTDEVTCKNCLRKLS